MSLIVLEKASLSFGAQRIFDDVNLRIGRGEKIGLIGPNGSGKSTLLRVMMDQQSLDAGELRCAKGCRIGYLPQDILELEGDTLLLSVLATVPGRVEIEERLTEAESELETATDVETQMELATLLGELGEKLGHFDLFYGERKAIQILTGLGFRQADLARPTAEFSGGWKMRAALAGLLFQQPDVLFMDEPTNHLDLPSVLWLDTFMKDLHSATVLICHDRNFLNGHIERVVSFEPEGVRQYTGNYDSYLEQRENEEEILGASVRNRERELKEMERFVTRFKAKATKARQAQSRARRIKRLRKELDGDRPARKARKLSFSFPEVTRTGRDVVHLKGISKAFGELKLYENMNRSVYAGDRIAIVGVNGAGKTTLLRIMAEELKADAGEVVFGANVELGYYAQHHNELLNANETVVEEVRREAPASGESFIRGVCGAFLFSGDDVDKVVGVLSGGERARVLLARLLVKPGNLLLMDEPTNHLDVAAADALANALNSYQGTLVFVSHNTTFVNQLANKVWDISDGDVIEYPGTLTEYLDQTRLMAEKQAEPKEKKQKQKQKQKQPINTPDHRGKKGPEKSSQQQAGGRDRKRREAESRNELSRRTRKIKKEIETLEVRIAEVEDDQKRLTPDLSDPDLYTDHKRFQETLTNYEANKKKIEELYARWEHQSELLEKANKKANSR